MHSRAGFHLPLDPNTEPAIHRSIETTHRSSTSAIVTTCEHTSEDPNPTLMRQAALKSVTPKRQPNSPMSGVENTKNHLLNPHDDTAAIVDFPQLGLLGHPMSLPGAKPRLDALPGGRCGIDLFRTRLPSSRHPKVALALGPPPCLPTTDCMFSRTLGAFIPRTPSFRTRAIKRWRCLFYPSVPAT